MHEPTKDGTDRSTRCTTSITVPYSHNLIDRSMISYRNTNTRDDRKEERKTHNCVAWGVYVWVWRGFIRWKKKRRRGREVKEVDKGIIVSPTTRTTGSDPHRGRIGGAMKTKPMLRTMTTRLPIITTVTAVTAVVYNSLETSLFPHRIGEKNGDAADLVSVERHWQGSTGDQEPRRKLLHRRRKNERTKGEYELVLYY